MTVSIGTIAFGTAEAAKRLSCSERMVRNMVKDGRLGHFKIGEDYRFTDKHIAAYIAAHTVKPAPAIDTDVQGGEG